MNSFFAGAFGITPDITLKQSTFDLQHVRTLKVNWASGKKSTILLDQGMGYWKAQMASRNALGFNFTASADTQEEMMQRIFDTANMRNIGNWPTYITVVNY